MEKVNALALPPCSDLKVTWSREPGLNFLGEPWHHSPTFNLYGDFFNRQVMDSPQEMILRGGGRKKKSRQHHYQHRRVSRSDAPAPADARVVDDVDRDIQVSLDFSKGLLPLMWELQV